MDKKLLLERIVSGTQQITPRDEFDKLMAGERTLTVKFGMDPTAPDIHLGHTVVLSKLRLFQELGHRVVLLIGDFTTLIGDPTGRSKTRPPLDAETIAKNAETYLAQVGRVLDLSRLTIRHNAEWLDKLSSRDWVKLCAKVTLARIIEREDFVKRMRENQPIGFHELLYPLMQGYDSVELRADIELGGTDQTFNLLMGRHLQEQWGMPAQVIMTTPLLEGLDGVAKMSKSLGNYIGLTEEPDQVFGKIMSISDTLMWRYFELLLNQTPAEIAASKAKIAAGHLHPMELKKDLAAAILEKFWGHDAAVAGREAFERLFQKRDGADFSLAEQVTLAAETAEEIPLVDLLKLVKAVTSGSEARRLISSGAVSIDGEKVTDIRSLIDTNEVIELRVGKHRFFRITR
ncbi:MAG: tyrosine--tRNA ligase [Candidatus Dependentiae bacterium]|nr:tyrosine--tRNA ligase [Candidatus Dependentiae bacterium]